MNGCLQDSTQLCRHACYLGCKVLHTRSSVLRLQLQARVRADGRTMRATTAHTSRCSQGSARSCRLAQIELLGTIRLLDSRQLVRAKLLATGLGQDCKVLHRCGQVGKAQCREALAQAVFEPAHPLYHVGGNGGAFVRTGLGKIIVAPVTRWGEICFTPGRVRMRHRIATQW